MPYDRNGDYFSDSDYAQMSDALNRIGDKIGEKLDGNGKRMTDAFTRVADALEKLTTEVKGLRADMKPDLGKPKLNTPQAKG